MFNLKSKTIFAVMLIFGITAFMSCEKNETKSNLPPNDVSNSSLSDSIGYWHNVAVKSVFKTLGGKVNVNYKSIREEMIKALNSIDSSTFDLTEMHQNAITSDNILSADLNRVVKDSVLIVNSETYLLIFDYLLNNNKISSNLHEALVNLNSMVDNSSNNNDFLNAVHQLSSLNWSSSDQLYVNTLTQVVDASYEFWVTNGGYSGKSCTLCIIWADAAGGLYGSIIGPGGAIIESAVFSTLAYINDPDE